MDSPKGEYTRQKGLAFCHLSLYIYTHMQASKIDNVNKNITC